MTPSTHDGTLHDRIVLLGLLLLASLGLGWILLPFYGSILWGCVLAMLFMPLHRLLFAWLGRRRTPAALATLLIAFVAVVLPMAAVMRSLASTALEAYERLTAGEWQPARALHGLFDALPPWARRLLDGFGLADFDAVQRRLDATLAEASRLAATRVFSFGQDTLGFVVGSFVMLYLAFFMLRDGELVHRALRRTIPLAHGQAQALIERFVQVIRAVVKGQLVVAALQGLLGGLAFWVLGVGPAVLWGVVMAFLSLVPLFGAALVWAPVAIWFIATGSLASGLALMAFGVLVIGLADNLLRPRLVGRDTRLPDYVILLTTLGGISVFGVNGLLLGPAIAAMFASVWRLQWAGMNGAEADAVPASPSAASEAVAPADPARRRAP